MPCVLIVEDHEDTAELVDLMLTSNGYRTIRARNGFEALEQMAWAKPCLVLLDMMMPVMDGWEFRRRQLENPVIADIPVIGVTAYYDPGLVEEKLGIRCIPKSKLSRIVDETRALCGPPVPNP